MGEYSDIFVGLDVAKDRHAVAIAEGGRDGDLRYFGEIGSDDATGQIDANTRARPDHATSTARITRVSVAISSVESKRRQRPLPSCNSIWAGRHLSGWRGQP